MSTRRQRRVRLLGSLLLVGLMLVPLAASGHYHAAHASTSCVTCSVAQHTPFVDASIVSMPGGTRFVVDLEVVPAGAPAGPSRREPTSRGPPALLLVHGT